MIFSDITFAINAVACESIHFRTCVSSLGSCFADPLLFSSNYDESIYISLLILMLWMFLLAQILNGLAILLIDSLLEVSASFLAIFSYF